MIHARPMLAERFLLTLFARLLMVGLAMAVVCWIGWFIPAAHDAQPLPPAVRVPVEGASAGPKTKLSGLAPETAVNVNQATAQELEQLPGIGPVLAGRIVEYRKVRGAFANVDQLRRVKGIGRRTFERIRAFIAVVPADSISARKTA